MNDFTKEELKALINCIEIYTGDSLSTYSSLKAKLKSMLYKQEQKGAYLQWLENELRELENDNK